MNARDFEVGDKVVVLCGGYRRQASGPFEVDRKLKNGNLVVSGYGKQQFRPGGRGTGDGYYAPTLLLAESEAGKRELAHTKAQSLLLATKQGIDKLAKALDPTRLVPALERISELVQREVAMSEEEGA